MADWDTTFDQRPINTDLVSDGDDDIQDGREEVRRRLTPEHDFGTASIATGYNDTGLHAPGSAVVYFQAAAPDRILAPNGTDNNPGVHVTAHTSGIKLFSAIAIGGGAAGTGANGRLWVDADDDQLYVRDETGVSASTAPQGGAAPAWRSLWPRSFSQIATATTAAQEVAAADTWETLTGAVTAGLAVPDDGRPYELLIHAAVPLSSQVPNTGTVTNTGGAQLVENDGVGDTVVSQDKHGVSRFSGSTGLRASNTLHLIWANSSPTPGSTYTYTVQIISNQASPAGLVTFNDSVTLGAETIDTFGRILVVMQPRLT